MRSIQRLCVHGWHGMAMDWPRVYARVYDVLVRDGGRRGRLSSYVDGNSGASWKGEEEWGER